MLERKLDPSAMLEFEVCLSSGRFKGTFTEMALLIYTLSGEERLDAYSTLLGVLCRLEDDDLQLLPNLWERLSEIVSVLKCENTQNSKIVERMKALVDRITPEEKKEL
jgi:hypothetical protein